LIPVHLEVTYRLNAWEELEIERRTSAGGGSLERRDAAGLDLDHLSVELAWGVLF